MAVSDVCCMSYFPSCLPANPFLLPLVSFGDWTTVGTENIGPLHKPHYHGLPIHVGGDWDYHSPLCPLPNPCSNCQQCKSNEFQFPEASSLASESWHDGNESCISGSSDPRLVPVACRVPVLKWGGLLVFSIKDEQEPQMLKIDVKIQG